MNPYDQKYNNKLIITGEKINIDGFEFDKEKVTANPLLTIMLIICSDPTEKQMEVLDKLEIRMLDDRGKQFYPRLPEEPQAEMLVE